MGAEGGHRRARNFKARHLNCGQRRNGDLGDVDVVEADDGEIVGHAEAGAVQLVQDADSGHVVGTHDGGWHLLHGEQAVHGGNSTLHGVIAFDDPCRFRCDATLFERSGKCGPARLCGMKRQRAADEGDISMPQGGEVLHALQYAVVVVDFEHADARSIWPYIDEHQRHFAFGELIEQGLLDPEGHHGYAIDFALEHTANAVRHALGFIVGGADEDLIAVGDGYIFEPLDELGEEWIGDFGDDEAEELAATGDQSASLGVGKVVELVDHLPDALGYLRVDRRDVIDRARSEEH